MEGKNFLNIDSLSRILILVLVLFVPILFYPNNIHFFANLKLGIFFGFSVLVLILWSISRLKKNEFKFPSNLFSLSIVLILLSTLISAIFSDTIFVSIFGVNLTALSFVGVLLFFIFSLLVGSLFKKEKNAFILISTIYFSLVVATLVNLIYIFFDLPNFGFFVNNSINTIGKWSDLGIISAMTLIISYLIIETHTKEGFFKKFAWVGLILSAILALVVSETVIWILLGVISVLYLIYKIVSGRTSEGENKNIELPYTTIAIILVSFVMILAGNLISRVTDQWLNINFSETKPGVSSTIELTRNTLAENPILGVGPNRFERAWQQYKPEGVNLSNFWGTDFVYGYSFILSLPAQLGILGTLSWLMFIVFLVWNAVKLLFIKTEKNNRKINIISSIGILFLLLVMFVQVPSVSLIFLFFTFLGLFIGSLDRNGLYPSKNISIVQKPKLGFLFIFAIIVLMILSIYVGFITARQFAATLFVERANYNIVLGDLDKAGRNLENSINIFPNDLNFRALSNFHNIRIGQLLSGQEQGLSQQAIADSFRIILSNSINSSVAAINFDSSNYLNYLSLASTYEQLVQLDVEGAYEQAIESYKKALEVNPNNPGIYIDMARTAFIDGRNREARDFINQSLEMKPQFVDAAFLLSQIQVSEGNITDAISGLESTINIQPNDPNLYFQLGLLRYNNRDYQGAVGSFERAVILNPVFANAKYFLGLSYDLSNQREKAIQQFEDVEFLNPENQEVKTILSNLRSGRGALEGLQVAPQDRGNLPVDEPQDENDNLLEEEQEFEESLTEENPVLEQ